MENPWLTYGIFCKGKNGTIGTTEFWLKIVLANAPVTLQIKLVANKQDVGVVPGLLWFGLCCLMTPGFSKDIQSHV